jgi:hypothetical protein
MGLLESWDIHEHAYEYLYERIVFEVLKNPNFWENIAHTLSMQKINFFFPRFTYMSAAIPADIALNLAKYGNHISEGSNFAYIDHMNSNIKFNHVNFSFGIRKSDASKRFDPEQIKPEYIYRLRAMAIASPHIPLELLHTFLQERKTILNKAILKNPNCSLEIMQLFAHHSKKSIRAALAQNINCPDFILEAFSQDESIEVRRIVARHPNTPILCLVQLFDSKDEIICQNILKNPQILPEDFLLRMLEKNTDTINMGMITRTDLTPKAQYPTQSEKNIWNSLNNGATRYHFMSSSIPTRVTLCWRRPCFLISTPFTLSTSNPTM